MSGSPGGGAAARQTVGGGADPAEPRAVDRRETATEATDVREPAATGPAAGFAVLTVIHDSGPEIAALLASLDAHLPRRPQTIVVDALSTDDGPGIAEEHGAEVVRLGANPGFGAANVAGLTRARHDVTVLLNPDVVLRDDGLLRLVAAARERDALHVPRLRLPDGRIQDSAHPPPGRLRELVPALFPPRALPRRAREAFEPWRATRPRAVGWAIAAAVAARTATLRELGPFDPNAFLFYEDLELCLHAASTGRPTLLHPGVELEHASGHSTARLGAEVVRREAERRRAVVRRFGGRRALALDDAAQGLTFATRLAAKRGLRRPAAREAAQLRALGAARRA